VLRRFANFDEALLRRVFAVELAQLQLPEPIGPRAMLARVLAELGQGRGRALMALEWLEQAVAEAEPGANAALLADLSGRLDPLGIGNEVPSPPKRPDPVRPPEWEYVGDDWPDTDGRRDGWEHPSVLATQLSKWHGFAVTLASTLPLGVYHEAPVITHDNPAAHNFIMTFGYVLARAAAGRRKLSVLDWGGGLGHYAALAGAMLPEVELEFTTFDLPLFTQAGRDHQVGVRFSADAEHCLARRYDLIFASGSLQYERDWVQLLRRFAASSSAWVFLTRTPFVDDVPGFVVVQRPFSTEGYQTEYLSQVFNRQSLLREAADCGLRIDREFMMIGEHVVAKGAPAGFGYRGFLFAVDHAVQDGFDEAYYLRRYPDVARAVLLEGLPSGRHHYEHHGRGEGRLPTAVGERERA
jgi:putative methyltransferase (TIGR04325 family)